MAGTAVISTIKHDVSGAAPTFRDGAGNEIGQLTKCWGNFNGSTPATNASFNVSSFSRVGTGCYTITTSIAMSDANYSYGTNHQYQSGSDATSTDDVWGGWMPQKDQTSTTFSTFTRSGSSGVINCFRVLCHVFR